MMASFCRCAKPHERYANLVETCLTRKGVFVTSRFSSETNDPDRGYDLHPVLFSGEPWMVSVLRNSLASSLRKNLPALALAIAGLLLAPGLTSCGGGTTAAAPPSNTPPSTPPPTTPPPTNPPPTSSVTVALSPHLSAITTSQSQTITATLTGGTGTVLWLVDSVQNGNAATGTITSTGDTTATYSPGPATTFGTHSITGLVSGGAVSPAASVSVTDLSVVFTHHNDNARTGANLKEYALTPATVSSATFGKLFSCALDAPGYVYAEPLYVANLAMNDGKTHNVVFIATESDWVYAYDADSSSCQQLWKKNLLGAGETTVPPADTGELKDLIPEIGITSTPVIDVDAGLIYVCAKSKTPSSVYIHRLHAMSLASGAESVGPVEITANLFVPLVQLQRPALTLSNGTVYVAFGSHGDHNGYQGWLMGYDANTLSQKFVWSSTDPTSASANLGAIWQSGGGLVLDSSGNLYLETGNGTFDADTGGINYSDSVVKLTANGTVLDYFTPFNQSLLATNDIDLGSSGSILLPDSVGSPAHPHLMVATGKPGFLYLLDQTNLGKYNSVANQDLQEVEVFPDTTGIIGGMFGPPAYWNGNIYTAAVSDALKQFTIASGTMSSTPHSQSAGIYNKRGAVPAVSGNGTSNGIVWALDIGAYPTGAAILNAYDATNLASQLYSSPASGTGAAGLAIKLAVPTVANGKVYVGSQGQFDVFGLLPN
jgi:hypothetical protein